MNSCVSCAHGPAMETTPERSSSSLEPPNHVAALPRDTATPRSQLRDLIAILALPAVWSGRDAADIPEAVLEVLSSMLRLDLAYIRAPDASGSGASETVRVQGRPDLGSRGREIASRLAEGTKGFDANETLFSRTLPPESPCARPGSRSSWQGTPAWSLPRLGVRAFLRISRYFSFGASSPRPRSPSATRRS